MKTVLAFDIATHVGIAFGKAGETPLATSISLGVDLSHEQRFAEMVRGTRLMLEEFQPDLVVFEAPVGGPRTSHLLVGIVACFRAQVILSGYGDDVTHKVNIGAYRKHFLGHHPTSRSLGMTKNVARTEIKAMVLRRCLQLGWKPRNEDEADAMALWHYGAAMWGGAQAKILGGLFDKGKGR